ncbi:hypothetical protein [Oleiphilus sp. HI0061]|nr:hypothetical protein [Oleiphilus sp. HI0061]
MVCVAGAEQPQPYALLMLSDETFAKQGDESFRKQVEPELEALMKEVNASVDPHEALQFMVVVNQQWTIENEFLTPTMKIKRNVIEDVYAPSQDGWYGSKQKIIWQ